MEAWNEAAGCDLCENSGTVIHGRLVNGDILDGRDAMDKRSATGTSHTSRGFLKVLSTVIVKWDNRDILMMHNVLSRTTLPRRIQKWGHEDRYNIKVESLIRFGTAYRGW